MHLPSHEYFCLTIASKFVAQNAIYFSFKNSLNKKKIAILVYKSEFQKNFLRIWIKEKSKEPLFSKKYFPTTFDMFILPVLQVNARNLGTLHFK